MRKLVALLGLLIGLASPATANAWFFFFIPGSVTSAISDKITGAEGDNCVGPHAKIGDRTTVPGRGTGTIKSLSGTSVRCTTSEYPIRALIDFTASPAPAAPSYADKSFELHRCVYANSKVGDGHYDPRAGNGVITALTGPSPECPDGIPYWATVRFTGTGPPLAKQQPEPKSVDPNTTQAKIDIPDGWVQQPVSDALKAGGVVLGAWNSALDAGLQLATFKRSGVASTDEFVASRKANQLSRLRESQSAPTIRLVIDGLPAWRYEVSGEVLEGKMATYTVTIVEGAQELVSVMAWTTAAAFREGRGRQLTAIADSLIGLPGYRRPAVANTPAPVPQATVTPMADSGTDATAAKLRSLQGMLREGLITQEDYETKKRELLKAM